MKRIGIMFRLRSFWIGVHISPDRVCVNVVPCVTIWFGNPPVNFLTKGGSYGAGLTQKVTNASKPSLNQNQPHKHTAAPGLDRAQLS